MSHTPLPWEIDYDNDTGLDDGGYWEWYVVGPAKINVDRSNPKQAKIDAEFIQRAVNAHDDLLAACKAFLEKYRRQGLDENLQLEKFDQVAISISKAVAKAEGDQ